MRRAALLHPRRPRAVLDPVAPERQPHVVTHLSAALALALPAGAAAATRMLGHVGAGDFYDALALENAARAADWQEMARVQRQFHEAEPSFDERTRAYSESMRLTLHAATLLHLPHVDDLPRERHFFEAFLELHVTAFFENGAWFGNMHIEWCGALDVLGATRLSMLAHAPDLIEGAFERDARTVEAAELVRAARRAALRR